MSRRKKHMIYTIDFLKAGMFEDDDIYYMFDTPSLKMSLIVEMFRRANAMKDEKKILNFVEHTENWFDKYKISMAAYKDFISDVSTIYSKLYCIPLKEAESKAQWWYTQYGFKVSDYKNI